MTTSLIALWTMSGDHVDSIHLRVSIPVDTINLLDTESFAALNEVANHRQRFLYAFNLLQAIGISRIEIGGRAG